MKCERTNQWQMGEPRDKRDTEMERERGHTKQCAIGINCDESACWMRRRWFPPVSREDHVIDSISVDKRLTNDSFMSHNLSLLLACGENPVNTQKPSETSISLYSRAGLYLPCMCPIFQLKQPLCRRESRACVLCPPDGRTRRYSVSSKIAQWALKAR